MVFVSGQGPIRDGKPAYSGRLGAELTLEEGKEAARLAMLNCLAQLKGYLDSLNRMKWIVKVLGFVACTEELDSSLLSSTAALSSQSRCLTSERSTREAQSAPTSCPSAPL
ncbi:MAG: RidA family protein [Bacteroidota bacterium]